MKFVITLLLSVIVSFNSSLSMQFPSNVPSLKQLAARVIRDKNIACDKSPQEIKNYVQVQGFLEKQGPEGIIYQTPAKAIKAAIAANTSIDIIEEIWNTADKYYGNRVSFFYYHHYAKDCLLKFSLKCEHLQAVDFFISLGIEVSDAALSKAIKKLYSADLLKKLMSNCPTFKSQYSHKSAKDMLLETAIKYKHLQAMDLLRANGAQLNAIGFSKAIAAHLPIDVIKKLLEYYPHVELSKNDWLHDAISSHNHPVMDLLIKLGADVNQADGCEWTPLMSAIRIKDLQAVEFLIDHGASVNFCQSWEPNKNIILGFAKKYKASAILHLLKQRGARDDFFAIDGELFAKTQVFKESLILGTLTGFVVACYLKK